MKKCIAFDKLKLKKTGNEYHYSQVDIFSLFIAVIMLFLFGSMSCILSYILSGIARIAFDQGMTDISASDLFTSLVLNPLALL